MTKDKQTIRIYADVDIDPKVDGDDVCNAVDTLLETALATPGILGDLDGSVEVGAFGYLEPEERDYEVQSEQLAMAAIDKLRAIGLAPRTCRSGEMEPCDIRITSMEALALTVLIARFAEYTHDASSVKIPQSLTMCGNCGSIDVEHAHWVNLNTDRVGEIFGSYGEADTMHCPNCEEPKIDEYPVHPRKEN
jgi:hypothetical protein